MTAALSVLSPGLNVTVQDLGRAGFQALGVPTSGALDAVMLRLANWLAGNDAGEGALEMRFSGPSFAVCGGAVHLALAGEAADIELLPPFEGRYPAYRGITLEAGQRFRIALRGLAPCYLAIEGGFALQPVLGSLSTLTICGLGGFEGRALRAGDALPLRRAEPAGGLGLAMRPPKLAATGAIRVMLGPQNDHFTDEGLATFLGSRFTVSQLSDRMGLRLDGPAVAHAGSFDLVSDGNAPGAIQVPGSGRPIVLMPDRGTTGGYPKIATVIGADLPALGRLPPGAALRFRAVGQAEAVAALAAHDAWLAALKAGIGRYRDPDEELARALLEENIISGVADASA
jgi:biotin-dependent carboxylase-like uncharacterized protein